MRSTVSLGSGAPEFHQNVQNSFHQKCQQVHTCILIYTLFVLWARNPINKIENNIIWSPTPLVSELSLLGWISRGGDTLSGGDDHPLWIDTRSSRHDSSMFQRWKILSSSLHPHHYPPTWTIFWLSLEQFHPSQTQPPIFKVRASCLILQSRVCSSLGANLLSRKIILIDTPKPWLFITWGQFFLVTSSTRQSKKQPGGFRLPLHWGGHFHWSPAFVWRPKRIGIGNTSLVMLLRMNIENLVKDRMATKMFWKSLGVWNVQDLLKYEKFLFMS